MILEDIAYINVLVFVFISTFNYYQNNRTISHRLHSTMHTTYILIICQNNTFLIAIHGNFMQI